MSANALCKNCGAETNQDMQFCSRCGKSLRNRSKGTACVLHASQKFYKSLWFRIASISLVTVAIILSVIYINSDMYLYKRAFHLYETHQLEEALNAFLELDGYLSSDSMVQVVTYDIADSLFDQGRFGESRNMFLGLGEFGDSSIRALEGAYALADELYLQGDLSSSYSAFAELGDFQDSREREMSIRYEMAEEFRRSGDLASADSAFTSIFDYSDSYENAILIRYEIIDSLLNLGNLAAVDSIHYTIANDQYMTGRLDQAMLSFSELGDYEDARERMYSTSYEFAEYCIELGDIELAYEIFFALGNYSDSRSRARDVRFEVNGNVIIDVVTNLEWIVGPDVETTRIEAGYWVSELGGSWRLPTQNELLTLYYAGIYYQDWGPFENRGYWVYSDDAREISSFGSWLAWGLNFEVGRGWFAYDGASGFGRAFAVRDMIN